MGMSEFCVQTIARPPALRAADGVLRLPAMLATADAVQAAAHIVQQAQQEAAQLRATAQQQAAAAVQQQQQQVARQATDLLTGLQQAQQQLFTRVESLVVELAQHTFDRLVLAMTPREQVEAMLRRVVAEAPDKLVAPVLLVHPDDMALLPASPWECKSEATLRPGTCSLQAATGEWRADFGLAVAALRSALEPLAEPPVVPLESAGAEPVAALPPASATSTPVS